MSHAELQSEVGDILPVNSADVLDVEAENKLESEHLETATKAVDIDYVPDANPDQLHHGWRRILRKNPSLEFMQEVAVMNDTVLDPKTVKRVGTFWAWRGPAQELIVRRSSGSSTSSSYRRYLSISCSTTLTKYARSFDNFERSLCAPPAERVQTTLSYAALFNISADLKMSGTDYSNLGSIFNM